MTTKTDRELSLERAARFEARMTELTGKPYKIPTPEPIGPPSDYRSPAMQRAFELRCAQNAELAEAAKAGK